MLARYGGVAEFRATIFGLSALDFFALASSDLAPPRGLDGNDNFLPERPSPREAIAPDPFPAFMPIYLAQLRDLLGRALAESGAEHRIDNHEQVFLSPTGEMRLDWGSAEVPQIETYFERYHRSAPSAVRAAGMAILDADPDNRLRVHLPLVDPTLARDGDQLAVSVTVDVDARHDLSVYAKTERRIRFEVRRLNRGRYTTRPMSDLSSASPAIVQRLMHVMFDIERYDASRLVRWTELFEAFDEPDVPWVGDLTALVSHVVSALGGDLGALKPLLDRLLIDGGVTDGPNPRFPSEAIRKLVAVGVLRPSRLRTRRPTSQHSRYQLSADYRWLRERLLAALKSTAG